MRTTAREEAAWISEFYVSMHSLAASSDSEKSIADRLIWMADASRLNLPDSSYAAAMYDFVKMHYIEGSSWEEARDAVYQRYQVEQQDGYDLTSKNLYCNGCFASGINFAASLVSLFYGKGDLRETIKIGALCGWDSDNPTATWGGLIGFMIGKSGVEAAFGTNLSDRFNIHRTRQNFENDGIDTFENMAQKGIDVIDHVVVEEMSGIVDFEANVWRIPKPHAP